MNKLPDPLFNAVVEGMQMLLALRLNGAPAEDTIAATAQSWEVALTHKRKWEVERDLKRFQTAFKSIAASSSWWPAPVDFLEKLPPVPEPLRLEDKRQTTPEQREKNRQKLKAILGRLMSQKRLNSD